jgi:transcriptional regulator with XRE-family HTH domain
VRINVGARIRTERKAKGLSQADLERRCGLARCRISWLEHGRAIPTVETLARVADALEIPAYRLLMDVGDGSGPVAIPHRIGTDERQAPGRKDGIRLLGELRTYLRQMSEEDKLLLVYIAERMAGRFSTVRGIEGWEADRNGTKPQVRDEERRT